MVTTAVSLEFVVGNIKAQKDEYRDRKGNLLSANDFWTSQDTEADVEQFKRFKVDLEVHAGKVCLFELHFNPRSDTVRILTKSGPLSNVGVMGTLHRRLATFYAKGELPQPVLIGNRSADNMCEVAVHDAVWYVGMLHQLRDFGPIAMQDNQWAETRWKY